jgi:para-aminobenzoate synthetase component 1
MGPKPKMCRVDAAKGGDVILLEDGPGGQAAVFDAALETIVVWQPQELRAALDRLDLARAQGRFIAGYMSYEAGYALEPALAALMPQDQRLPLLAMGIYAAPLPAGPVLDQASAQAGAVRMSAPEPMLARADYGAAFRRVKDYIAAGDCYQINLTFPMRARLVAGTALGLFAALSARQKVRHGALVDLGTGPVVVSRSPELFLSLDSSGRIETRPMKGTAPRDPDPVRDGELAEELRASEKGQAENLMIVDLLRNDISRIAKIGSVKVPKLFAIESYATLHQMVSTVVGQLAAPASLSTVMAALFPCGSITGAPKIRAMQIIREVEPAPRGAYCGAIGWMGPDGAARFNVAIRTLQIFGDEVVLNVGGGIVQDSTEEAEWEEALWKARYARGLMPQG